MADDLKDIKVTDQMIQTASRKAMAGIIDPEHPELTAQLLKQNANEVRNLFEKELKKLKFEELGKKLQNELLSDIKKQINTKKNFFERIGFIENKDQDQFKQLYRARQIAGGLETIAGGQIGYGIRQIATAFPAVANFMTGPYYLAIKGVTTALKLLDAEISKTKKEISAITGGVFSPYQNNYIGAELYETRIKEGLSDYGLRDKALDIAKTVIGSTPIGDIYTKNGELNALALQSRTINQGAAMNYLGSLGISSDSIEKMFRISRTIEGMGETGALASQYRLAQRFRTSRFMTEGEGAQQSLALYEQTKSLGVNFEWASRTVRRFDEALQKGEITLNDFAAVARGVKGADAGRATGIAAMIREVAIRNGINLPKEFMNSSDLGAGLYLQTREGIGNKNIQRALKLAGLELQGGMNAGTTQYDQARGLQLILQGIFGSSLSADAALKVQRSGDWDILLGGRGGVKPEVAKEQAEALKTESQKFYKNTRSYIEAGTEGIKTFINEVKQGILVKVDQGAWFDLFTTAASLGMPSIASFQLQRFKQVGQSDLLSAKQLTD